MSYVGYIRLSPLCFTPGIEPATLCDLIDSGGWGEGEPSDQSTDSAPSRDFLKQQKQPN